MGRWVIIVSLLLLVYLSLAQDLKAGVIRGKRRKSGQRQPKDQRHQAPQALKRRGSATMNPAEDGGMPIFMDSYRSLDGPQSNYNVLPGKQGQCMFQGIAMFDKAVWSPKPCVTCLCTGGTVVCDEITCPKMHCHFPYIPNGECCPVCMDTGLTSDLPESISDLPDFSGDSPVPNDPNDLGRHGDPITSLTQEEMEMELVLKKELEQHREKVLKQDAERKRKRKKQKKEEAEKRRKLEEQRRREEEALRAEVEREEEERRQAEERRLKEAVRENERRLEEERLKHELALIERLRALEEEAEQQEDDEEEELVWLRGDVFEMEPKEPTEGDGIQPIPAPPGWIDEDTIGEEGDEEEEEKVHGGVRILLPDRGGLPQNCDISDVIVTCENAQLTRFPALFIPELKSLSLEGNAITTIPEGAFNGIPNLEWINLGKNKLTSSGIAPQVFRSLKYLSRLYLDMNLLDKIPTDLPSTLQELKINENQIKGIDNESFQGLSNLVTLEMEGNLLSEGNVDISAFAPLTHLSYMRLGRNHFRTIPQGLPPPLLELYLENNLIEEITENVFNETKNLNVVNLRHNRLDETRIAPRAWIEHRNLESIDLSHNQLYLVPSYLPRSLVHLVLVNNQIERIPGYVFAHMEPGIEYLYLSHNKLDGEGFEPESFHGAYSSMVELCIDHNQLIDIPPGINEMMTLHFLRLNNNHIRDFAEDAICDPLNKEDSHIIALRLENNYIEPRDIPRTAFSCVRSYSSVVLKPQKTKKTKKKK